MTIEQLGEYLQMSRKSIYEFTHQKKIPFTKVGRRLRFRKDDIDRWLEKNTHNQK
jgi:excisionase family DNA binding protein